MKMSKEKAVRQGIACQKSVEVKEFLHFLFVLTQELVNNSSPHLAFLKACYNYKGPLKPILGRYIELIYFNRISFNEGLEGIRSEFREPLLGDLIEYLFQGIESDPVETVRYLKRCIPDYLLAENKIAALKISVDSLSKRAVAPPVEGREGLK